MLDDFEPIESNFFSGNRNLFKQRSSLIKLVVDENVNKCRFYEAWRETNGKNYTNRSLKRSDCRGECKWSIFYFSWTFILTFNEIYCDYQKIPKAFQNLRNWSFSNDCNFVKNYHQKLDDHIKAWNFLFNAFSATYKYLQFFYPVRLKESVFFFKQI